MSYAGPGRLIERHCYHAAMSGGWVDDDPYLPTSWLVPVRVSQTARSDDKFVSASRPDAGHVAHDDELPAALYVPVFPLGGGYDASLMLELWERDEFGLVAVGYSVRSRLVDQLGSAQPWLLIQTAELRRLLAGVTITALLLDPPDGTVQSRWTKRELRSLVEVNDDLATSRLR